MTQFPVIEDQYIHPETKKEEIPEPPEIEYIEAYCRLDVQSPQQRAPVEGDDRDGNYPECSCEETVAPETKGVMGKEKWNEKVSNLLVCETKAVKQKHMDGLNFQP